MQCYLHLLFIFRVQMSYLIRRQRRDSCQMFCEKSNEVLADCSVKSYFKFHVIYSGSDSYHSLATSCSRSARRSEIHLIHRFFLENELLLTSHDGCLFRRHSALECFLVLCLLTASGLRGDQRFVLIHRLFLEGELLLTLHDGCSVRRHLALE